MYGKSAYKRTTAYKTDGNKFPAVFILAILIIQGFLPAAGECRITQKMTDDGCLEITDSPAAPLPGSGARRRPMPDTWDSIIIPRASSLGMDPFLIKCIISVESDFTPDAVSPAGAMGLMQLMQETAACYNVTDPLDPVENLRAGITHFASLYREFNGDIELALAAYHAGMGRVKRRGGIPPIRDTQEYVKRVMALYGKKPGDGEKIRRLYKRIEKDGTILFFNQ